MIQLRMIIKVGVRWTWITNTSMSMKMKIWIEEIEIIGKEFDPKIHESVEEVEGADPGIIIEEVQKGYTFQGKIIRIAKVKVGSYHSWHSSDNWDIIRI